MYCNGVSLVTSATATPHFEWEVPWEKPPVDESRGQGADGSYGFKHDCGHWQTPTLEVTIPSTHVVR